MTLGESIRKLRKQHNMSQEQLAEKLDVSRQSVSLWEKDATQPTIDNIITLSDIFGVTVDELLKSNEPIEADSADVGSIATPETHHNAKRCIIAALDAAVLAVGIYWVRFCATGTQDFLNVLDLHFSGDAVLFIELSPIFIGALSAAWLLTAMMAFVKAKPCKVLKTVIIMLGITLFAAANLVGGLIDNGRETKYLETIPEGVSYLDIRAFENIATSSEYEEQYIEGQIDAEIPVHYAVTQEYAQHTAHTECVEFTDNDDKNSELSRYYLELEAKHYDIDFEYFTDAECAALGIKKCAYSINQEENSLSLIMIKGSRVYYCYYDNLGVINDVIKEQIRNLK
jgi:transcriptional regulator with XRE-family HTH domain